MARFNTGKPKINTGSRGGPRKRAKVTRGSYGGKGTAWSPEWKAITDKIKARDGHRCTKCKRHLLELASHERLEVDHLIPISRGGSDHPSNLATKCSTCHGKRLGHGLTKQANHKRKMAAAGLKPKKKKR